MSPIKEAIEALDLAQRLIDWCRHVHPQQISQADHEADAQIAAALAALRSMPAEPVATIRYERGTPGKENDMPKVVSCNWLPDGVYSVYTTPPPAPVLSDAEILALWSGSDTALRPVLGGRKVITFARAIEQAIGRASRGAK